jgi:hypothetical protein
MTRYHKTLYDIEQNSLKRNAAISTEDKIPEEEYKEMLSEANSDINALTRLLLMFGNSNEQNKNSGIDILNDGNNG